MATTCKIQKVKITNCKIEVVNTCISKSTFYTSVKEVQGQIIYLNSANGGVEKLDFCNVCYPQYDTVVQLVNFMEMSLADCQGCCEEQEVQTNLLQELIDLQRTENTGLGDWCLASDESVTGRLEVVRNEDGTIKHYELHRHDGTGVITGVLSDFVKCADNPFEVDSRYTFNVQDGETFCFPEIVARLAAAGITTTVNDIVGFEFDLKPVNGDAVNGFVATTSDATSTGAIGDFNFDGFGSVKEPEQGPSRLPDGTFKRLENQCFTAAAGSVAVLTVQFIKQ